MFLALCSRQIGAVDRGLESDVQNEEDSQQ